MAMVVSILDASSGLGYGTRAGREEYGLDVDDIEPYPDASYKPRYTDYSRLNKTYDAIISNAVLNVSTTDTGEHILYNIAVIQEKEEAEISPHSGDGLDPEEGVPGKPYNHPPKARVSQPDTDVKQKSDRDVAARDTEYLELAKDPVKNAARLQEMVDEAAEAAGAVVLKPGRRKPYYIGLSISFGTFLFIKKYKHARRIVQLLVGLYMLV